MKILVLTDNLNSWYIPYAEELVKGLVNLGHNAVLITNKSEITACDFCFLLSCTKIVEMKYLELCNKAIVIHGSDLPEGKGFSPIQWQVFEGKNEMIITALEAAEEVDSGDYYLKENLIFNGDELLNEIRTKLASKIYDMAIYLVENFNQIEPKKQIGRESFYPKRTKKNDALDKYRSILDQFNHFRIADNDRYPLYFDHLGYRYYLKIEKRKK